MSDIERFALEALDHYGVQAQVRKAAEECEEAAAALSDYLEENPGVSATEDAIDEVADALVMMTQMRIALGSVAVDERIAFKIARQRARMEAE